MAPTIWSALWVSGGTSWTRTNDLTLIKRLLYQLSYGPDFEIDDYAQRRPVARPL